MTLNPHLRFAKVWLYVSFIFLLSLSLLGQEPAVSDPTYKLEGTQLHIYYDILNSTQEDVFEIRLIVKNYIGITLTPNSLSGDIGMNVKGGGSRHIVWDLAAEEIDLSEISIKIEAEVLKKSEARASVESEKPAAQFSRTGLLLQSVAFPGLGLSRYRGGPHWLKGIAAYSCVAGAIVYNQLAIDTYGQINENTDFEEKEELYEKSIRQDNVSEGLAYGAIAIWVIDLVWTYVGTSDMKKNRGSNMPLSIHSAFDSVSGTPLLVLNYRF